MGEPDVGWWSMKTGRGRVASMCHQQQHWRLLLSSSTQCPTTVSSAPAGRGSAWHRALPQGRPQSRRS